MIIFGLNALAGRSIGRDGSAVGDWDSSNAESLMRYTVKMGYNISGWELGKNALSFFAIDLGRMMKSRIPMSFSLWAS